MLCSLGFNTALPMLCHPHRTEGRKLSQDWKAPLVPGWQTSNAASLWVPKAAPQTCITDLSGTSSCSFHWRVFFCNSTSVSHLQFRGLGASSTADCYWMNLEKNNLHLNWWFNHFWDWGCKRNWQKALNIELGLWRGVWHGDRHKSCSICSYKTAE